MRNIKRKQKKKIFLAEAKIQRSLDTQTSESIIIDYTNYDWVSN